jgi:hypothetical protein
MIVAKVDSIINDFQQKTGKAPELILINSADAENFRMELVKLEGLESESNLISFKNARIIRSDDIFQGELKLF